MKITKIDLTKNHLRVVERFAFLPKRIFEARDNTHKWVFWAKYYELQLSSQWGYGWILSEESMFSNTWDFKWDSKYLALWV